MPRAYAPGLARSICSGACSCYGLGQGNYVRKMHLGIAVASGVSCWQPKGIQEATPQVMIQGQVYC